MKKNSILFICLCLGLAVSITGCSETPVEVSLGQYLDLEVEYAEKVVSDADIENAIIDAAIANQEDVEITNRAVRNGDTANINYVGKVDGVAFDGGTAEGHNLEIGSGSFIEGFEEQVIGMKIGQTKDIKVVFPDPYQNNPDLSGAETVFTVKVNSITGKKVPSKITDAMIKEISDTYKTVKDYRKYIKSELVAEATETNNQRKQDAVWKVVLASSTAQNLSSKKIKYYSNLFEINYQYYADMYGVDLDTLIADYMGMTRAEFNAEKKTSAEEQAKNYAIVEAIADEQSISVSDDEYQAYLDENSVSAEDKKTYGELMKDELLYKKVVEFISSKTQFIKN